MKRITPHFDELAAEEEYWRKRFEATGKARAAIVTNLGGPWQRGMPGASGKVSPGPIWLRRWVS